MNAAVETCEQLKPARTIVPIHPTANRVIVQPVEVEQTTRGGIVLAEQSRKYKELMQSVGYLVAAGPAAFERAPFNATKIKTGDLVLFGTYAGQELVGRDADTAEHVRLRIMNDSEITALVSDPSAVVASSLGY